MHKSYRIIFNRKEDFKVKYVFRTKEEGGRNSPAHQGIRSDFWYENKDNKDNQLFMIWPEFENEIGELISIGEVASKGIARMWIVNKELRKYHQERIRIGTKGYFMEGENRTADCEVVEIVDLMINETNEESSN